MIDFILFIGPLLTVVGTLILGFITAAEGVYTVVILLVLLIINFDVRCDPIRLWCSSLKGTKSGATLLITIAAIGIHVGSLN
ncbi:MAG: hypothetical protein AB8B64_12860 [Granulosicoccus sp.]